MHSLQQECISSDSGPIPHMHVPRFRKYGGFRYWRAAAICQLQALVLLVQILLQDGYAEGQVHPCTKL